MNAKPRERQRALTLMRELPWMSDREIAREIGVSNKTVSRWRADSPVPRALPDGALATEDVIARVENQQS